MGSRFNGFNGGSFFGFEGVDKVIGEWQNSMIPLVDIC